MPDASNCVLAQSDKRKLETSQPEVADGYISLERTKLMIPCVVSGPFLCASGVLSVLNIIVILIYIPFYCQGPKIEFCVFQNTELNRCGVALFGTKEDKERQHIEMWSQKVTIHVGQQG
jgi:hypothetical protein